MVIPYRQDVPPPGGFPSIDDRLLKRGLPKRGPSSIVTVSLMGITVAVGFFFTVRANKKNRELKMEQRALRANIVPFLVAEEDQRWLRSRLLLNQVEATVMKDVPDWKVGEEVYKTRWMPPSPPFKTEV
mmetsp:Transcript_22192/g.30948  ORF Transcript_22192/g.30948 Transcript_22192/m.30948 type:complete len:129 (+) Transcript_22192:107-493(+)